MRSWGQRMATRVKEGRNDRKGNNGFIRAGNKSPLMYRAQFKRQNIWK